jgi:hypothetical protein
MTTRRVDLRSGPVVISAAARGCIIDTLSRATVVRDRAELQELIDALFAVREDLIEGPGQIGGEA